MTRFYAQRGQSLAEFLISLAVLVPLYLAVDYAGKYGDLHQTAVQASRYAAMQRVLEPSAAKLSNATIQDQTRARFFLDGGRNGGKLRSDDTAASVADHSGQTYIWRDNATNPLLTSPAQVAVTFADAPMAPPAAVGWFIDGWAWTAGQTYTGGQQARVELTLKNKLDQSLPDAPDFKIGAATAAVGAGWASSGSAMTAEKASTIVPSSMLPGWASGFIEFVVSFFEPWGPEFGCIKPDIVAPDRLDPFVGNGDCQP